MESTKPKHEKMSKSRGNVITPDEVIYGVCELEPGFVFCDRSGRILMPPQQYGIWRNRGEDNFYYTGRRFGHEPVFLCQLESGVAHICRLLIDGEEREQHPAILATLP